MRKLLDNKLVRFLAHLLLLAVIMGVLLVVEAGLDWTVAHFFGKAAEHVFGWAVFAGVFTFAAWSGANPRQKKGSKPSLEEVKSTVDKLRAGGFIHSANLLETHYGLKPQTPMTMADAEATAAGSAKLFAEANEKPDHIG